MNCIAKILVIQFWSIFDGVRRGII
uniref:Uncharacterized protein n=1 Tax=Arundo donax TaxID=35708 RepID=A0A0A8Z7A6_ARUDO